MITQAQVAECFEYRDGTLYWRGVTHPNKQYLADKPAGSLHKTGYRHVTLRAANRSENQCNRPALASNTSGYPGVSWHKKSKAWVVRVMKNGKTVVQEYFKDLELAGLVAEEARAKFHGQFAHQSLRARVAALEAQP